MTGKAIFAILLIGTGLLSCEPKPKTDPLKGEELFQTVEKYVSLGEHRTGTPADTATSFWLGQELQSYGYKVNYLEFPVREFFPGKVSLSSAADTIPAFPLWWVNEQVSRVVSGTLVEVEKVKTLGKNTIALIHLPRQKSSPGAGPGSYLDSLAQTGVVGIVAITDNPSGEIQAYNTSTDQLPWKVPVILVAPKDSAKVQSLVKQASPVTLAIEGTFRDVKGRNVYGTIGQGEKYIVVSTPISGWFTCGGERGSGLAVWLALAKWVASEKLPYTFVFTGNSGHEHAFMGAHQYLEHDAPPKEKTHLWIHFGAGVATLDYQATKDGLVKQSTVDAQRRFFYNAPVKASFEKAFQRTEAQKILVTDNPGGELLYVAQKGYPRFAGVAYSHPFFHVRTDDASTTSPEILEATARAFRDFLVEETKP